MVLRYNNYDDLEQCKLLRAQAVASEAIRPEKNLFIFYDTRHALIRAFSRKDHREKVQYDVFTNCYWREQAFKPCSAAGRDHACPCSKRPSAPMMMAASICGCRRGWLVRRVRGALADLAQSHVEPGLRRRLDGVDCGLWIVDGWMVGWWM